MAIKTSSGERLILNAGFEADLLFCLALERERATEVVEARLAAMANEELRSVLAAESKRRGLAGIDWPEYFRNAGLV